MKTVYALVHARTIRYVGCTGDSVTRLRLHWSNRYSKTAPVALWLRTLSEPPNICTLQEVSDDAAHSAEEYWINLLRQVPSVDLLNVNDRWSGSTGRTPGFTHSDETRRKISETHRERGTKPSRSLGERNGASKLTDDQVRAIRADPRRQVDIAAEYGIAHSLVSGIKNYKSWKHV